MKKQLTLMSLIFFALVPSVFAVTTGEIDSMKNMSTMASADCQSEYPKSRLSDQKSTRQAAKSSTGSDVTAVIAN